MTRFGLGRCLRRLAAGLTGVALMAGAAGAQDAQGTQASPANPQATISVTSRLVVLDVVVLDRSGRPVTNLNRSQFAIVEDKEPQTIRDFDPPSAHGMPKSVDAVVNSAADLPKIGHAPVDVLVLDEVNTPFHDLAYARQMMEKYLRAQPEVLPVPTLFVAAGATRMAVLHDYTQSRAELLASIKTHTGDFDFTQLMNSLNGGRSGADEGMVKSLGALSQIAESLRGVPGHKNVIWMGTGYDRASDLTNMSEADHDKVLAKVEDVTNKMLAARVTLYTIDPEGPSFVDTGTADNLDPSQVSSPGQEASTFDDNLSFNTFATATGGRTIGGRNDIDAQLAQVETEGTEYYTLTYVPSGESNAAAAYRRIRVMVNDSSLRVVTRTGYFPSEPPVSKVALAPKAKQAQDVKFDLMSAARTTLTYTGLHTQAQRTKNGYAVLVNANDLKFAEEADGARTAEVTVLAVCYNNRGKELSQRAAEMRQELGPKDVIAPQSQVAFQFSMVTPPFTSRVRFVVRDAATGTLGSVNATP